MTGIEVQSYGTDAALLEELRGSWPPRWRPTPIDGYRPIDLAGRGGRGGPPDRPAGPWRSRPRPAVRSRRCPSSARSASWRRPGRRRPLGVRRRRADGVGAPDRGRPDARVGRRRGAGDRRSGSDASGPGLARGATCSRTSPRSGSTGSRRRSGRSPGGRRRRRPDARPGRRLPAGARDGWEWWTRAAERVTLASARATGRARRRAPPGAGDAVVGHRRPIESAGRRDRPLEGRGAGDARRRARAHGDLELTSWAPAMRAGHRGCRRVDRCRSSRSTATSTSARSSSGRRLRGDRLRRQPDPVRGRQFDRQPRERDIAQMTTSLDHVGRVIEERGGGDRSGWIAAAGRRSSLRSGPSTARSSQR